jgi:hypothetical protein
MTDPNNLEGTRTPEELAASFRELDRVAPTPAHKFQLMFSAMNLPANLPPLPPVPSGFDRWEYRGANWRSPPGVRYAYKPPFFAEWQVSRWSLTAGNSGEYIEAVRDNHQQTLLDQGLQDNLHPS